MSRNKRITELAALLDGEVLDQESAQRLSQELLADDALMAEYELQREVKAALAQAGDMEPPQYLATRVMGEIAARRSPQRRFTWRTWVAVASGTAACLLVLALFVPRYSTSPQPVSGLGNVQPVTAESQPGVFMATDDLYKPQDWSEFELPEEGVDPQLEEFLQFANDAHNYAKMLHATESVSPDLAELLLLLSEEGDE
jgi:hypothetical protein